MNITSAQFIQGLVAASAPLKDSKIPHVAVIGRSNVGKSSLINSLTHQPGLARVSAFPGHTQEVNLFLINKKLYLADLPGYGFAKTSKATKDRLWELINWYLFNSPYGQKKVILLIDSMVGVTDQDHDMLEALVKHQKHIAIVATKVDKLTAAARTTQIRKIQSTIREITGSDAPVIPYSSKKNIGVKELTNVILDS